MIRAEHRKWADRIFKFYIFRLLKKNFSHFYRLNDFPQFPSGAAVLTPNHISWWDGFFMYFLQKKIAPEKKLNLMMLEKQLKRYSFFKKVGAFSIDPDHPAGMKETVYYFRELLEGAENWIVLYPQGEIQPYERATLKQGLQLFLKKQPTHPVIPVGFRILYENEKNPALYMRFGEPLQAETVVKDFKVYEDAFFRNLKQLNRDIYENKKGKDLFGEGG
jgi:1-acyl-sn-glycerol-3-phosphate acyltransferase